ncbi:MAG: aspartate aminotransferase family protein, partial [Alphaproteobacteria bacterium]|nr:aspartate aminotransferase family protein [Alphaproteobacteria bacterium]
MDNPQDWTTVRTALEAALKDGNAEPPVTIRTKDAVWRHARAVEDALDGEYDWTQPAVRLAEAEMAAFVRRLTAAPADAPVTVTSGGTESLFLALHAAREWAKIARPEARAPTLLMPTSGHAAATKAARYLGLAERRVPLGSDGRADAAAMEHAIDANVVAILGSVPSDSRGLCDDMSALGRLAERANAWLHADACIGGFLVPFLKAQGAALPAWNFDVPAVRSISLDAHKYGYAPTGVSTLILRNPDDLAHQRFDFEDWDGPPKSQAAFAGTRSAAPLAGAWAAMRLIGWDGYARRAAHVHAMARRLAERLRATNRARVWSEVETGGVHFGVDGLA